MSGGGDTDDMKIVKNGDGAWRNAVVRQARGKLIIVEQVSQHIDSHSAVAHDGYRAAAACEIGPA